MRGIIRAVQEEANAIDTRLRARDITPEQMRPLVERMARLAWQGMQFRERLDGGLQPGDIPGYGESGIAATMRALAESGEGSERAQRNKWLGASGELAKIIRRANAAMYVAWTDRALESMGDK